jgi:hypothetical protein
MFSKVTIKDKQVIIPQNGKKKFIPNVKIEEEQFIDCLNFSKNMAY